MGCFGSIFRFMFFVLCTLVIVWFGGLSIVTFFSALFGESWIIFWKVFAVWIAANYGIGWLFEVRWKNDDTAGEGCFATFIYFTSILIFRAINKIGKIFIKR
ncbi:hypothetical protein [Metabacillus litoralis]|uniref:hypothetical protein n=1 Tax=Metabacillus litoralis TaxID=152268 RepID=UPI000A981E38|nr:hypothetical protein [Metabacillus litoralis]